MSETSHARAARRGRAAATRGGGQESGGSRGALYRSPCGGGVGGWIRAVVSTTTICGAAAHRSAAQDRCQPDGDGRLVGCGCVCRLVRLRAPAQPAPAQRHSRKLRMHVGLLVGEKGQPISDACCEDDGVGSCEIESSGREWSFSCRGQVYVVSCLSHV